MYRVLYLCDMPMDKLEYTHIHSVVQQELKLDMPSCLYRLSVGRDWETTLCKS